MDICLSATEACWGLHGQSQNADPSREFTEHSDIRQVAQKPHEPHVAFVHCAKPQGNFEICEVSTNYFNVSLPEAKERCCGEREHSRHCLCRVADVRVWEEGVELE